MMHNPFDTPEKKAVRELWNAPLLRYLNNQHGFRYRYMGLPGVELLDVRAWQDMIDEVIAFEAPAEKTEADPQGRKNIIQLRKNLNLYGINGMAYFGPMEEVVLLRKDYDGEPYQQNQIITLYNLDFCDEISSPVATRERGVQFWRYEVIRQILLDQHDAYRALGTPTHFIILLTIRDQISVVRLRSLLSNPQTLFQDSVAYLGQCGGVDALPEAGYVLGDNTWALKVSLHNIFRHYFGAPHISALFFPLVKYNGTPVIIREGRRKRELPSPMLHWMILCRFDDYGKPSPTYMPLDYLQSAVSIRAYGDHRLDWQAERGEVDTQQATPDSEAWFKSHGETLFRTATHREEARGR